jgi:hypothetical protein
LEGRVNILASYLGALILYLVWTALTYGLEGRQHTLLRPEAARLRLIYAVVANLLVGIVVAGWFLSAQDDVSPGKAGFHNILHAAAAVVIALLAGGALYLLLRPPTRDPMIVLNGFAQVWTVSAAEVVICWSVVGSAVEAALRDHGVSGASVIAALVASLLFGLYHIAHSPPFNSPRMMAGLSVVGLLTSAFFFLSRDVYGTIVFHNFFGMTGVLSALSRTGAFQQYRKPVWPLLITAGISAGLIVVVQLVWLSP